MWIARDLDGTLTLFKSKPERQDDCIWVDTNWITEQNFLFLDNGLFSELKWEDEPIEVDIIPKKTKITRDDWQIVVSKMREVLPECINLKTALDLYKSDRDKWIDWYNKKYL